MKYKIHVPVGKELTLSEVNALGRGVLEEGIRGIGKSVKSLYRLRGGVFQATAASIEEELDLLSQFAMQLEADQNRCPSFGKPGRCEEVVDHEGKHHLGEVEWGSE